MIRFAVLSIAALIVSGAGSAIAQEAIANRFTMEKTENGFVRMDTETGEMSICTEKTGQLVCRLAADERRAFEETLSDLSDRVAALEQRLESEAAGDMPEAIPDEAELDRALEAMNKMMRGFFGMVEDLRKEFDQEDGADSSEPPKPLPDRT